MNHPKDIRLKNYDYRWNGAYFITIACQDRKPLFASDSSTLETIQSTFTAIEKKYPYCQVIEQIIMPDHLHFIFLFSGDDPIEKRKPLSDMVQEFKSQVTRSLIQKVKQGNLPPFHGKIWQKGYYERVLRSEEEVYQVRKYIQENPLKLALLKEEWKKKK